MTEDVRLVDQILGLDVRIRSVVARIDGRLASRQRVGSEALRVADTTAGNKTLMVPRANTVTRNSAAPDRGSRRSVVIQGGDTWRIAMACRGGEVSIEVDAGADPIDVVARVAEELVRAGR